MHDAELPDGATPLDPDDEGLIPRHIATRGELNEAEEANIARAYAWGVVAVRRRDPLADDRFVYELHRRMFDSVWEWAGDIRRSNKNIGVDRFHVRTEVRDAVADAWEWRRAGVFGSEEIAVRLHHRLVYIHPFPNGNGRHARLVADLCRVRAGRPPLDWGRARGSRVDTATLRRSYIGGAARRRCGELRSAAAVRAGRAALTSAFAGPSVAAPWPGSGNRHPSGAVHPTLRCRGIR